MREIEFRGKGKRSGEWIAGSLLAPFEGNGAVIFREGETDALRRGNAIYPGLVSVDPDTVGQYTGLRDKHGKKIYEGDILAVDILANYVDVRYDGGGFYIFENDSISAPLCVVDDFECMIIGNIHDNPELLRIGREEKQ